MNNQLNLKNYEKFIEVKGNRVLIFGDLYDAVVEGVNNTPKKSGYRDKYQRGAKNTLEDPRKAEREGKMAECAWAHLIGKIQEFRPIEDYKTDFVHNGMTLDVKNTTSNKFRLKTTVAVSDLYVGFKTVNENKSGKSIELELLGYFTKNDVISAPIKKSPLKGSDWENREIEFNILKPFQNNTSSNINI